MIDSSSYIGSLRFKKSPEQSLPRPLRIGDNLGGNGIQDSSHVVILNGVNNDGSDVVDVEVVLAHEVETDAETDQEVVQEIVPNEIVAIAQDQDLMKDALVKMMNYDLLSV